jgi:hypothetical protein
MNLAKMTTNSRNLLTRNGTTEQTVRAMREIVNFAAANDKYLKLLSKRLKNDPARLLKAFRFAYLAARYERDLPDVQTIRTPKRLIREGRGNCVDYSVLLSALLKLMNEPHVIKVVKFKKNTPFAHVYVKTINGVTLTTETSII